MKLHDYGKWTRIRTRDSQGEFKVMVHKGHLQAIEIRKKYPNASRYTHLYHGKSNTFTLVPITQISQLPK